MLTLKRIVLVLPFLLFYQYIFADCGHCFTIVKVKIIYNSGNTEISNLKFFRQYILDNNDIEPKENESIKKYFPQNIDTIQLIDSIYKLEKLPAFINKENKRDIALKEITDIYLIKWTTIQGAGELPYLSGESIERIINSDTVFVNTKIFNVHDEIYIYIGTKLSLEDFNVLIKESYNYADSEPSIIGRLKINKRKNIYPDKAELSQAFEYYFKEINKRISSTSEVRITKEIDAYFQAYSNNLKKRKRYLEFVLEYLNTTVATNLENFIKSNIEEGYQMNELLKEIDNQRDVIKNTIALVKKLYIFNQDNFLNEQFYKILKKENIVVLHVSWD